MVIRVPSAWFTITVPSFFSTDSTLSSLVTTAYTCIIYITTINYWHQWDESQDTYCPTEGVCSMIGQYRLHFNFLSSHRGDSEARGGCGGPRAPVNLEIVFCFFIFCGLLLLILCIYLRISLAYERKKCWIYLKWTLQSLSFIHFIFIYLSKVWGQYDFFKETFQQGCIKLIKNDSKDFYNVTKDYYTRFFSVCIINIINKSMS